MMCSLGWFLLYLLISFSAFPGVDRGWLAWVSMVPLFLAMRQTERSSHFLLSVFAVEWIRWIALILWLRHVSWGAVIGIAAGFAFIHALWLWVLRWNTGRHGCEGFANLRVTQVVGLAALWAVLEWCRTQPLGLPGAHFSITQWQSPLMLQISSVVGGYGLSALLVLVNLWFAQWIFRWLCGVRMTFWLKLQPLVYALSCLLLIAGFGGFRLSQSKSSAQNLEQNSGVRIGLVQPKLEPHLQWNYERMVEAVRNVWIESNALIQDGGVDLIFWPEGTLPAVVNDGGAMQQEVEGWVSNTLKVPVLFGNQALDSNGNAYNAVLKLSPQVGLNGAFYAKRILVPFGEFIPFRRFFPGIETIVPIPSDFGRGLSQVVISVDVDGIELNISPLICYEDCFPGLLLEDALEDVDLIFVATYNGWYGEEFGAYFHAAHSVLRAVEVGRSVVRCGSAGWSGWIDRWGQIRYQLRDADGSIYFRGHGVFEWREDSRETTLYYRWHEWVHASMLMLSLLAGLRRQA